MALFVRDKYFYRTFLSLTAILALQNLITFSVNMADNVMIGSFSESALAGVALANQIQFILQMVTVGIGEGVVILCSQYWGRRQLDPIRRITGVGLAAGLSFSLLLWAAVYFFPRPCLSLFTDEPAVLDEGVKYIRIICFSYFLFTTTGILLCALRSVETVRIGFIISLAALLVNICLNYMLIFGRFGAPRLGSAGAAIATLISRVVELSVLLIYLKTRDKKLKLTLPSLWGADRLLVKDYIHVGLPVIMTNALWGIAMGVQTMILGHMGSSSISANSIATTVFQVLTVVTYGAGSAASVVIGKTIGEGRLDDIRNYSRTLQVLFLIIGLATGAGLFACRDLVISFYAIAPQTQVLARQFINVLCVTVVGTSYQVATIGGIIRGGGSPRFQLYNDMFHTWVIVTPLSLLAAFVFNWPPVVIFACLKCDQILKCFVGAIKVNRYHWVRTLTREQPKPEIEAQ